MRDYVLIIYDFLTKDECAIFGLFSATFMASYQISLPPQEIPPEAQLLLYSLAVDVCGESFVSHVAA